jgi:hypothetical protein
MSDEILFKNVVHAMHHGIGYYPAMNEALRAGGYATGSVFNWRPPLLYWALADLPIEASSLHPALPFTEVWAGVLIALSACLAVCQAGTAAVLVAGLAVMIRELSLPYVLVLFGFTWRCRGWWYVLPGLAIYYGLHWWHVGQWQQPGDPVNPSWLAFGGPRFLLSTFKVSVPALLWPAGGAVFTALALLIGLVQRWGPRLFRLTIVVYGVLFCIVGLPVNWYWGFLVAPIQALAMYEGVKRAFPSVPVVEPS